MSTQARDYGRLALKVALSSIPVAGPLISEVVNEIIPGDRVDRITDFVTRLDERIAGLEQHLIGGALSDPEFIDLIEEALRQSARAISNERRIYLAELVANSLTDLEIAHSESKHLMRILGELSDVEILWLKWFYLVKSNKSARPFEELHKDALDFQLPTVGSPESEKDRHAVKKSYINHLNRCGLIQDAERAPTPNEDPRFARMRKLLPSEDKEISQFGSLMLRSIGLAS
jgi:hypothetical protein